MLQLSSSKEQKCMYVCTYVTEKEQTSVMDGLAYGILMLIDHIYIKNSISRELLWEEKHKLLLKNIWSQMAQ